MPGSTTSYGFNKPVVGGDTDSWGGYLNDNWDDLDDLLDGTTTVDGIVVTNASGTFTTANINGGTQDGCTYTDADVTGNRLESENEIKEGVQTISGTSPTINPASGGTIGEWTLTASTAHTPTITMNSGESILLHIQASTGTITWPTMTWVNGEPTLEASVLNVVQLWKVGSTLFGAYVGSVS